MLGSLHTKSCKSDLNLGGGFPLESDVGSQHTKPYVFHMQGMLIYGSSGHSHLLPPKNLGRGAGMKIFPYKGAIA